LVAYFLIAIVILLPVSAAGVEKSQYCLKCHSAHYGERGRCSDCHLGNPASERKAIAHSGLRGGKYSRFTLGDSRQLKGGELLMDQLACRRCHVSASRGNNLAVRLDGVVSQRSAGELAASIRQPVENMPKFALNEDQITIMTNAVLAAARGNKPDISMPVTVHFRNTGKKGLDVFSTKCGSCHRILSQSLGALGKSDAGPNLSGLLTRYYPKTYRSNEAWSVQNMQNWLTNPRVSSQYAKMLPVTLTEAELKELVTIINL
jgi:cytochrome c2